MSPDLLSLRVPGLHISDRRNHRLVVQAGVGKVSGVRELLPHVGFDAPYFLMHITKTQTDVGATDSHLLAFSNARASPSRRRKIASRSWRSV